jgi:hypothetical protein
MPTLEKDALVFRFPEIDPEARFSISVQRTLRIPDTDRDYPLPPGLGRFPLRHVEDCPKLPEQTRRRGGVVLPIWQAEALWLSFSGRPEAQLPVAIKVAAGKINAVTGERWTMPLNCAPQDYMVWPQQPWLDGFAVAPGRIRQFVAMPLGEGYSVEEHLTGAAEWGGLQISVTPLCKAAWDRLKAPRPMLMESPESAFGRPSPQPVMALGAGGRMRQDIKRDRHAIDDWDHGATQRAFVTLWHARHWMDLTGEMPPTLPPSAAAYSNAGLPWFEHYGCDTDTPLPGSTALQLPPSVAELHKTKTGLPLPDSEDVETGAVHKLGPGARASKDVSSGIDW